MYDAVMMLAAAVALFLPVSHSDFRSWTLCYVDANGIWVANGDGTEEKLVAKGGSMPKWSPDKKRIVYAKDTQVWVVDRDGKNATRLHDGKDDITGLAWGPALPPPTDDWYDFPGYKPEQSILFTAGTRAFAINVFRKEFSPANEFSQIDPPFDGRLFCPAISPDGKRVAVSVDGDVWLADHIPENGGWEFTRIAALAEYDQPSYRGSRENYYVLELDWSPAGHTLVYCLRRIGGSGFQQLGLLAPNLRRPGTPWISTILNQTDEGGSFSPNGEWIVTNKGAVSRDGLTRLEFFHQGLTPDW